MLLTVLWCGLCCASLSPAQQQVWGRVNLDQDKVPHPVRNDVAQPNDEIVTLRYFRIKKGAYDDFYKASVDGVWPYFEKLGSRVIGMWKVIEPDGVDGLTKTTKDYDEVYLTTRYANVEHWKASREGVQHGGTVRIGTSAKRRCAFGIRSPCKRASSFSKGTWLRVGRISCPE